MNNKCIYRIAIFKLIVIISTLSVSAQSGFWLENRDNVADIVTDKSVKRQSFPKEFKLFNLNIEPLKNDLSAIVDNKSDSTIISLPNADGGIEQFEVFEASNFEPELQTKFPDIRAFSGRGLTDRYATVKLSISPNGVSGTVFRAASEFSETGGKTEFIEPYSADRTIYAVYRSSREKGELPWACSTQEKSLFSEWKTQINTIEAPISNTGQIRTMRLAQSANGEYSNYFGATSSAQVGLVLAAYNATLTRANGVYERDFGLHLDLIPQSTSIIFYNPATDPYSASLGNWNDELRGAIIAAGITTGMYDIGHMFGASGGGGNAGCIGCVCVTGAGNAGHTKGRGITSPADGIPAGDTFDIDYVAHEVGHQLGANHTFSYGQLPIPEMLGQDKEIGSGITIMGYAGITEVDTAARSIDVFHETSINQVQVNLPTKPCPVPIPNGNGTPVVAPVINFSIPILTPFELTGSATDPDGDPITYNWEQNDSAQNTGITIAASVANPTKLIGPNFLTFPSTSSPTKSFPRLSTILAGEFITQPLPGGDPATIIEALSSITRNLNFRLTVRDNHPYVPGSAIGQTQFTDMTVSVTNTSGPFMVTSQDSSPTDWQAGDTETITWLVANSTLPPVSTANVDILLSTDGGQTFPITLIANTPNDGTQDITVPNNATNMARIKIKGEGNIFFDINNADFTIIGASLLGFESDVSPRNSGNGTVGATDVTQIRRFAVALDTYDSGFNEFQRADAAPLNTNGNGAVSATDIVQARRFQVALDPLVAGAGPTLPSPFYNDKGLSNDLSSPRIVRVVNTKASGKTVEVTIEADVLGDETMYGFSLDYNAKVLGNPRVSNGSDARVGQIIYNTTKSGQIGLLVDLLGRTMSEGNNRQLITIRFDVHSEANVKETTLEFSNSTAIKEVSDNSANALPINFVNGKVFFKR